MDSPLSDFKDELGEAARDVVKIAKNQIIGKQVGDVGQVGQVDQVNATDKIQSVTNKKTDLVTGKPVASKKVLSDLQKATAQVAQIKLKQIREELEKQRLKTAASGEQLGASKHGNTGPEIPIEPEKPKEDVVAKTLKQLKSTGEFGKNIGG